MQSHLLISISDGLLPLHFQRSSQDKRDTGIGSTHITQLDALSRPIPKYTCNKLSIVPALPTQSESQALIQPLPTVYNPSIPHPPTASSVTRTPSNPHIPAQIPPYVKSAYQPLPCSPKRQFMHAYVRFRVPCPCLK
ncbi:hypothetical protein P154DRAFT_241477 [Amniculicola lignicola CBS 123094]|uniref:Uncharacterized protein n=1 Tax=Amniculicola lignicola CBS 123094 TaxID=1392246 RepID=A0A6A5WAI8_9PLEO|nr:hypothetical protein P154DRAFT_241477 [Amniculicola lignicola CBS 123094]